MNKMLSILVTVCLLLSLSVGAATTAYAGEERVPLKIIALPEFAVGGEVADADIQYEAIDGVTVETEWQIWDETRDEYTRWFRVEDGVFESDRIYKLILNVVSPEGTKFNGQFVYDGETYDAWYSDIEEGDELIPIAFYEFGRYSDTTEITKVSIEASVPEVGEVATVGDVVLYDKEGNVVDPSAVTGYVQWQAMSKGEKDVTGEAFKAEDVYFLVTDFAAVTGYSFPEKMTLVLNGVEQEFEPDPKSAQNWQTYSLLSPLKALEITGLPEAKAGEAMPEEVQWDVEDAFVTVNWLEEDENVTEDTSFAAGKTYKLSLAVAMGYQPLAEEFVFVIDGETYEPTVFDAEYNTAEVIIEYKIPEEDSAMGTDDAEPLDDSDKEAVEKPQNESTAKVTEEKPEDTKKAPETGDSDMIMGWALLAVTAFASIVFVRRKEM